MFCSEKPRPHWQHPAPLTTYIEEKTRSLTPMQKLVCQVGFKSSLKLFECIESREISPVPCQHPPRQIKVNFPDKKSYVWPQGPKEAQETPRNILCEDHWQGRLIEFQTQTSTHLPNHITDFHVLYVILFCKLCPFRIYRCQPYQIKHSLDIPWNDQSIHSSTFQKLSGGHDSWR